MRTPALVSLRAVYGAEVPRLTGFGKAGARRSLFSRAKQFSESVQKPEADFATNCMSRYYSTVPYLSDSSEITNKLFRVAADSTAHLD